MNDNNLNLADEYEWTVPETNTGERLDKYISEYLGDSYTRSQIQQWIKDNLVKVNDQSVKASYKLGRNDTIWVGIPHAEDGELLPEDIELDVVYEDADVIVINKPRGMVVHPAPGHHSGTLVHALLHHCQDLVRHQWCDATWNRTPY